MKGALTCIEEALKLKPTNELYKSSKSHVLVALDALLEEETELRKSGKIDSKSEAEMSPELRKQINDAIAQGAKKSA